MNLRAFVFWLKDSVLGHGQIKRNYLEVKKSFEQDCENTGQLNTILKWATNEVPFYRECVGKSIEDFPVVNKNIIRDNVNEFRAQSYLNEPLHKETTSGSTGTPFTVFQDACKRLRATADSLALSDRAGFKLGSKLYYARVWNNLNKKSWFECKATNIVMQSTDNLSDGALESFLKKLERDHSEKSVLAYSSSLIALVNWMDRTNQKTTAKVQSFITMSESMPTDYRRRLSELFGCPVVSRYSNQECGLISQQCLFENEYHINTQSFYVEILDMEKDIPVEDGVVGRIVVTDLYNKAMPIIRYDTGDIGAISHKSKCGEPGKVLVSVEGRKVDCFYSTAGKMLSPLTIINTMWNFNDLKQFQFVQNDSKDYEIRINCLSNVYKREMELVTELKRIVGGDAQIKVTYVDEIPMLASGKRKSVVNNMKNKI